VKPWQVVGRARTPDGVELTLTHHVSEYVIMANGRSLMSSRMHCSEDALAVLGCRRAAALARPHVLVGGLGMGFTLRAALDILPAAARVVVAELVPAVIGWNRGPLGTLAKHPLKDPRVRIEERDVAVSMRSNPGYFDAVLLDVDNGPASLTASSNDALYDREGVATARASLRPRGTLAVWSANDNRRYERTLRAGGFTVKREHVSGHTNNRGPRHTILVAALS
jgi:spermidine synthase